MAHSWVKSIHYFRTYNVSACDFNAMFLKQTVECAAGNIGLTGCLGNISSGFFQVAPDKIFFSSPDMQLAFGLERGPTSVDFIVGAAFIGVGEHGRQVFQSDNTVLGQDRRAFDDILHLADIARPGIVLHGLDGAFLNAGNIFVQFFAGLLQKMMCQGRDGVNPVA